MYKNLLIEETGNFQAALDHLNADEAKVSTLSASGTEKTVSFFN
jgi:hypothetical protein